MKPALPRILFILKRRMHYGGYPSGFSSGLYNSAKFAADLLAKNHYAVKLVEVTDNNGIDREVHRFHADIVIIEALWVVPEKFSVLTKLHPKVKWIVRIHSEGQFLAQEGIAVDWITQYPSFPNVFVALNSREGFQEVQTFLLAKGVETTLLYLPTYYPASPRPKYKKEFDWSQDHIDIAAMGAIRPLKNHFIQAVAALQFAQTNNLKLRFHINITRIEDGGNAAYRSVAQLFSGTPYELIEHDWLSHEDFIEFLRLIDLSLQVSFNETFNIVMADSVASGVPVVASSAIRWLSKHSKAETNSLESIVRHMEKALDDSKLIKENLKLLLADAKHSKEAWLQTIQKLWG